MTKSFSYQSEYDFLAAIEDPSEAVDAIHSLIFAMDYIIEVGSIEASKTTEFVFEDIFINC